MFARDLSVRGKGLGPLLLADVFSRCIAAADIVGGRFIVLDALDERAERLYASMGFRALPSQPRRMVISMAKVRKSAEVAT
jgi:GNAT superfamily N-acetyltransferase